MDWVKAFQGVDIGAMLAVAVIACSLEYSVKMSEGRAVLITLALSALLGVAAGLSKASTTGTGVFYNCLYNALMNSGAAMAVGRPAALVLKRVWRTAEAGATDGK